MLISFSYQGGSEQPRAITAILESHCNNTGMSQSLLEAIQASLIIEVFKRSC